MQRAVPPPPPPRPPPRCLLTSPTQPRVEAVDHPAGAAAPAGLARRRQPHCRQPQTLLRCPPSAMQPPSVHCGGQAAAAPVQQSVQQSARRVDHSPATLASPRPASPPCRWRHAPISATAGKRIRGREGACSCGVCVFGECVRERERQDGRRNIEESDERKREERAKRWVPPGCAGPYLALALVLFLEEPDVVL